MPGPYGPYSPSTRSPLTHKAASPSPLRQSSTLLNSQTGSAPYPPSSYLANRPASGIGYAGQNEYSTTGHKRGMSDYTGVVRSSAPGIENQVISKPISTSPNKQTSSYMATQAPITPPRQLSFSDLKPSHSRAKSQTEHVRSKVSFLENAATPISPPAQSLSMATLHRADSVRSPHVRSESLQGAGQTHFSPAQVEVESLKRSTTRHLRTLSKIVSDGDSKDLDFAIHSRDQEVTGLHGRRRLQRSTAERPASAVKRWNSTAWMDAQRQFLQAYEYLCHIGEAKEWIEGILDKTIPEIVELEEALRDGVTLAEVVQALCPDRTFRIFRNPKLQYRHSDNIAVFFNFLSEVELPDLFRFELVDLYEKKNIPKVIYCIHALSWLLYRKNIVDFRIGNLVGTLQFEDHELEATQKGLDKAGVSMPNFSGVGANFVAPETEEDRIEREILEKEEVVVDFQSQVRGYMTRLRLGDVMQELWDFEDWILDLQCRIRGGVARQLYAYRVSRNQFVCKLQAATRGFLVRRRMQKQRRSMKQLERVVLKLQSAIRGNIIREDLKLIQIEARHHESGIRQFQAAIRGKALRDRVERTLYDIEGPECQDACIQLQSLIRGFIRRQTVDKVLGNLHSPKSQKSVTLLQSAIRGVMQRAIQLERQEALDEDAAIWTNFQSLARGWAQRERMRFLAESLLAAEGSVTELQSIIRAGGHRNLIARILDRLHTHERSITDIQSAVRGANQRGQIAFLLDQLHLHEEPVRAFQAFCRGVIVRSRQAKRAKLLEECTPSIVSLQSAARGHRERQKTYDFLCKLHDHEDVVIEIQSLIRAMNSRVPLGEQLMKLEEEVPVIQSLQALVRGGLVRHRFKEKMEYYQENMKKVVKIQSFIRTRQQGQAYKSLIHGKNPPVGTVKNFVHLLNDSDLDFDEELEFERLRKLVVQRVRQNEMAEQYINQLDIKIALLVKNKITLDEVIKHQKHFGGHVANLLANRDPVASKDPFDLRALNKNSRKKLEHYQEFFFILQTQPQYLSRLSKRVREQGMADKDSKRLEQLIMGIFGFAQKRREEYYLLKLISRAIREEAETCNSIQDFLRGSFFWARIVNNYIRTPRDRKFLRDFLAPIIREDVMNVDDLDLESDPLQIYRSIINNEELRTGRRSRRAPDIPREDAIRDPETRETFIRHLQDLRDIADHFFVQFEDTITQMPYGIRYITQQLFEILRERFPNETAETVLTVAGSWLWRSYIQPALIQPEQWSVIDRGLSPLQRRNLSEVAKVVNQIALAKLFGGDNIYLQPMNPYITDSIERLFDLWRGVISVPDAESQFDIDEFNDLYARTKPTLYIKLADIFAIHHFIANDLNVLAPSQDDVLREVIRELGSVKSNESELIGVSSTEVSLTLTGKFHNLEDPEAPMKAMFMETKRCILYIIRIQTGASLLDIMVQPVTREEEVAWQKLVEEELEQRARDRARQRRNTYSTFSDTASMAGSVAPAALDILSLSYTDVKRIALENIVALERAGQISRHNQYQDILNSIAHDMRTKNRRRIQRARELEGAQATLAALDEKAEWLDAQLKSYNDYVEQAMVTLQTKTGTRKKRFLLPFTKQYNHVKELQRTGRVPRFGSYKYSVRNLAEKGVVVNWRGYPERQWDRINLTISSDEVGIFHIEGSTGSLMIPGASAIVPLDDLLQAQFNNCQFMNLFSPESAGDNVAAGAIVVNAPGATGGGGAGSAIGAGGGGGIGSGGASVSGGPGFGAEAGPLRLNVNLLVHLLMRKFYREE